MKKIIKKILLFISISLLFFTCENSIDKDIPIISSSLKITNLSSHLLYDMKYSNVEYGDITAGGNKIMEFNSDETNNPLYFYLNINGNMIQFRTSDFKKVSKGSSEEWRIINDTAVTAIISNITGTLIGVYNRLSKPILELSQNNDIIENNKPLPVDFDNVEITTNKQMVFTIKNIGNLPLELNGIPIIESSNPVFSIPSQPNNSIINPSGSIAFIIRYTPIDEKEDFGTITIYNNSDDLIFTFNIKGKGYVKRPQITIKQSTSNINNHGEYNFNTVAIGEPKDIIFTIGNTGDANLTFENVSTERVILLNNSENYFTVIQPAAGNVTPNGQTTFTVRFNPTVEENDLFATVEIKTNSGSNNNFSFTVKGNGYLKRPQITLKQGNALVNQNGEYSFGTIFYNEQKDIVFTIANSGEAPLVYETVDNNRINLVNNDQNHFLVITQPSATMTVAPGGTNTFTVRFKPASTGNNFSAIVKIKTNSKNNDEFAFTLKGNCELAAPSGVTAVYQQPKNILVSWNPVAGATSYNVYYGTSNTAITVLAGSALTETSYTHTGLSDGTTYYYQIIAKNEGSESARSQTVSKITLPGIPSNLRTSAVSYNNVTLAWNAVTGAASYRLYTATTVAGTKTQVATTTSGTTFNHTNLTANTTSYYFVTAVNASGESSHSEALTVKTLLGPLAAPTNVKATAQTTSSIQVTWGSVSGAVKYNVYRATSANGSQSLLDTVTTTSYTNTGLSQMTYWYFVKSVNTDGVESVSSASASMIPKPVAPSSVLATGVNGGLYIELSWSSVPGATSYKIYSSTSLTGTKKFEGSWSDGTSCWMDGLQGNTGYFHWVIAVNPAGESDYSPSAYAVTAPAAPTNLRQTASTTSTVTIAWNSVSGATRYDVYVRWNGNYLFVGSSTGTSMLITDCSPQTTFLFVIVAYSGTTGLEGPLSEVSATTR